MELSLFRERRKRPLHSRKALRFFVRICIILFCVLMICSRMVYGQLVKLSGAMNYALNRPGVVMVRTVYSATVDVNRMRLNNRAFNFLVDSIRKIDSGGVVGPEQKLDIVLREMNSHPSRFFQNTFEYIRQTEEITASGTGFLITGDGYVATNCHLIDRDNAFIRRQFMLSAFQQITEANISALESAWATSFTEQQRSLLYNTYASVYSRLFSMVLNGLKKTAYVVYRVARENGVDTIEKRSASIVIKGAPMPGKDIAILKIETGREMPTLTVSASPLPQVGEQLFVYGYPGPVTNNDFVSVESAIEPTLTTGIVSAIKNSVNGWPVIQMDANINHGSSGGPVCNEKGEVVGLTTFGSLENSGALAAGLNFAVPVAILDEYLDKADITLRPGKASKLFAKGLEFYDRQHYQTALKNFQQVKQLNGGFPGIYGYITDCKAAIELGKDRGSGPVEHILYYGSLILLMAVAIARLVWMISAKRRD